MWFPWITTKGQDNQIEEKAHLARLRDILKARQQLEKRSIIFFCLCPNPFNHFSSYWHYLKIYIKKIKRKLRNNEIVSLALAGDLSS